MYPFPRSNPLVKLNSWGLKKQKLIRVKSPASISPDSLIFLIKGLDDCGAPAFCCPARSDCHKTAASLRNTLESKAEEWVSG